MAEIAISVQHLSKSYQIAHQANGARRRYQTLREEIVDLPRKLLSRVVSRNGAPSTETFWALKEVSFGINQGEVVGIIGRNGAGKSTLLKILSRITEPTAGRAEIFGRVGSLLEVGTGFHQELSGRENIFLNGAVLGMRREEIRHRFDEIVAFAEIDKFLDTPVKRYSSGMYVRLAFAVAAHLDPEILLVDEVLAVGDAEFQKKCLGKMGEVARGGRTVVFVSHNMAAVRHLCSRGIVLDRGEISFAGDTGQAIDAYVKSFEYSMRKSGDGARNPVDIVRQSFPGVRKEGHSLIVDPKKPLVCEMELSASVNVEKLYVNLEIFSSDGIRLVHIRNDFDDVNFELEQGTSTIHITMDSLPLLPDDYGVRTRVVAEIGGETYIVDGPNYTLSIPGPKPGLGNFQAYVDVARSWSVARGE